MSSDQTVTISLDQLPASHTTTTVQLDGQPVCVARIDDQVYAVSDLCTHVQISLSDGGACFEGDQLVCPWHGAMFDVKTGRATCGPASEPLKQYRVEQSDQTLTIHADSA